MTSPLPALDYGAPEVNPQGLGLYAAATVINTGAATQGGLRISGGVIIRPVNCDEGFGTWTADFCEEPGPSDIKEGDRQAESDPFLPVVPWAYDECDPQETEAQTEARAAQTLRLHEPLLVESQFAARLLADDGSAPDVDDILEALAVLEVALGEAGYNGFIHASRKWAPYAANANLIVGTGPILRTPLGNTWVFGGGYNSTLGDILVATGPVTVWRDEAVVNTALDPRINRRASVAERSVVAGYECLIASVTINPPAP